MTLTATTLSTTARAASTSDAQALTQFVRGVAMGTGFQTWEWGELKKSEGWDFDAFLAERNGKTAGSALVLYKRLGPVSMAYAPRGPVLANPNDADVLAILLKTMTGQAKRRGAVALRINPDIEATVASDFIQTLTDSKFTAVDDQILHTSTMRVDLTQTEEQLSTNLEKRALSAIKKGLKGGVVVKSDLEGAEVSQFYALLDETRGRHDFSIPELDFFQKAAEALLPGDKGRCFVAYAPDGEPLAGAFAMLTESRLLYVWGASSDRQRNLSASQVMHWQMMLWAKEHGLTEYDFHGVTVCSEGEPGWGVYLFKRAFGGRLVKLAGEFEIPLNPLLYPIYRRLRTRQAK